MDEFLVKLHKISSKSNSLILEKKKIEKRISSTYENIKKYEKTKQKYIEEAERKKKHLLKKKNMHLLKCQKMEELNKKLTEILIRKQNIDDEEEKIVRLKQIDVIHKMIHLLRSTQKLSDSIGDTNEHYKSITEQISYNNFSNRKTVSILNCFLRKNLADVQDKEEVEDNDPKEEIEKENIEEKGKKERMERMEKMEKMEKMERTEKMERMERNEKSDRNVRMEKMEKMERIERMERMERTKKTEETEESKIFRVIPTKEINNSIINLFSKTHTSLTFEKQQFLFVLIINVLGTIRDIENERIKKERKMIQQPENLKHKKIKQKRNNHIIHQFLYENYIAIH